MSENIDHKSRAHALLSASSAHRWLACPPSAVAAEAYPAQDTAFTQEGTIAHEVAEIVVRERLAGNYPDLRNYIAWPEGTIEEMVECAHEYADYILELITTDSPLILLEQRVDFSRWVPEGFGTLDCTIIQGHVMDVIDYKYGKGVAVSAEDNPQERLYALGALNDYGFAYDIEEVRTHIFQPRINNVSREELTDADLLAWGDQVKPIAQKAAKGKGTHKAGEHCRFCPHAGRCRTLTKTCTEYITTHGMKAGVPVLAPWEVAEVLAMEPLVTLWLKRVKDQALTTLLDGGEIPGYKAVEGRGSRAWADELEVAAELEKHGVSREDYTKTEMLSVAQMEKALGKKKVAELVGGHIVKTTGAPTVAPMSDKRPAYDRLAEAQTDFN